MPSSGLFSKLVQSILKVFYRPVCFCALYVLLKVFLRLHFKYGWTCKGTFTIYENYTLIWNHVRKERQEVHPTSALYAADVG